MSKKKIIIIVIICIILVIISILCALYVTGLLSGAIYGARGGK